MTSYLERLWQAYELGVVPVEASDGQRRQTQMAFYAGSDAVIAILTQFINGGRSRAAEVRLLLELLTEIEVFRDSLLARREADIQ
jgi:hypothetical protein